MPRSRSNYKYRRRNKSGGDTAAAGSDTEHDSEYWTRRRRTILQSLESAALLGAGSASGSGSSCSSGRDPVAAGCSCRHVHCPRCRHSPGPGPDCGHSGTAHTWHRVASPVFFLCTSSDPSAVMRMQFALDKASRAPVFEPCASVQG